MMARLYLTLIMLAVLIAVFFSDVQFLSYSNLIIIFDKEILINSQILLSGLTVLILSCFLLLGLLEKTVSLFNKMPKPEKKKDMATKE